MPWLRCTSTIAALLTATFFAAASEAGAADSSDALPAAAVDAVTLDEVVVFGRRLNLVGETISASEGSIGQDEIATRPLLRPGDLLEFVPGLVATQHSGSGKAISTSCAASISTTEPTSPRSSTTCQ